MLRVEDVCHALRAPPAGIDTHRDDSFVEAVHMDPKSNATYQERQGIPWSQVVKILLFVTLVSAILLLGLSMLRHRYFLGGLIDRHGHITQ
jgi:hypothetical protein